MNIKTAPLHELLSDLAYVQIVAARCPGTGKASPICTTCTNPMDREVFIQGRAGLFADGAEVCQ